MSAGGCNGVEQAAQIQADIKKRGRSSGKKGQPHHGGFEPLGRGPTASAFSRDVLRLRQWIDGGVGTLTHDEDGFITLTGIVEPTDAEVEAEVDKMNDPTAWRTVA